MLVSTVTVEAVFPGVITIFVIAFSSITVCVGFDIVVGDTGVTVPIGLEFGFFGSDPLAISSVSVTPSPSSSVSVTSGVPSLSVSLCTIILKVLVDVLPEGSLASTVTVNSFFSSLPQLVTLGVPLIFPLLYVKPLGRSFTVTVAVVSSVVTGISVMALPSIIVWSPMLAITGALLSFHTANTSLSSLTLFSIPVSAAVALAVEAQPKNW